MATTYFTRGGTKAVVFSEYEGFLFGAYEGKEGWYPVRWTKDGRFIENLDTSLDIKID